MTTPIPVSDSATGSDRVTGAFVRTAGTQFTIAGVPFRYVGFNSFDLVVGNLGTALLLQRLREMKADGASVVRCWAFSETNSATPLAGYFQYGATGGQYYEATFVTLDTLIDLARQVGLRLCLVLSNNQTDYGGKAMYATWYNTAHGTSLVADNFHDTPAIIGQFEAYITHLVTRTNTINGIPYAQDPTIMAWEIINEGRYSLGPDTNSGTLQSSHLATMTAWYSTVSAYIKQLDPNHLVGTGSIGQAYDFINGNPVHNGTNAYGLDFYTQHAISTIDFADFHWYPVNFLNPGSASIWANAGDYHTQLTQFWAWAEQLNKPLVIGETGIDKHVNLNAPLIFTPRMYFFQQLYDEVFSQQYSGVLLWDYNNANDNSFGINNTATYTDGTITPGNFNDALIVARVAQQNSALGNPAVQNLTLGALVSNSTVILSAFGLSNQLGSSSFGQRSTRVGQAAGWGEVQTSGTTNPWPILGSAGTPSGHGFCWDAKTLQNQQVIAGQWTFAVDLGIDTGNVVADILLRAYRYTSNTATYTPIGSVTIPSQTITSPDLSYSATVQIPAALFGANDYLYLDCWLNIKSNGTNSGTANVVLYGLSNGTTSGTNTSAITPGYLPQAQAVSVLDDAAGGDAMLAPSDAASGVDSPTILGPYAQAVLSDAPAGFWPLANPVGPTAYDVSGNQQHLAINGTVGYQLPGPLNHQPSYALSLDGSTAYLAVPAALNPSGWTALTLELWLLYTTAVSRDARLIANDHTDANSLGLQLIFNSGTNGGSFNVGHTTSTNSLFYGSLGTATGQWYHYAVTFGGGAMTAYLNGAVISTGPASGSIAAAGFPLNIGRNPAYNGDYWTGQVSNLAMYQATLSQARLQAHLAAAWGMAIPADAALGADGISTFAALGIADAAAGGDVQGQAIGIADGGAGGDMFLVPLARASSLTLYGP